MAKKERGSHEIDELKLKELEDVARGFEGSKGETTLAPDLAQVYEELGGDMDNTADAGNGCLIVPCEDLCDCVLGEVEKPETTEASRRRRRSGLTGVKPARKEGAAEEYRKKKKLSNLEKESNTTGRVHRVAGPKEE